MLVDLARNDMGRISPVRNRKGDPVYGSAELFTCDAYGFHWLKAGKTEHTIRLI